MTLSLCVAMRHMSKMAAKIIYNTRMESELVLAPGVFDIVGRSRTEFSTSILILHGFQSSLGLTGYQAAAILGVSWANYHRWKRGGMRMGSGYLARIIFLERENCREVPINQAQWIDWKLGEIHWRNGHVSSGHNLSDGGWKEPKKERKHRYKSAHLPRQYGEPTSPQPEQ